MLTAGGGSVAARARAQRYVLDPYPRFDRAAVSCVRLY
jgi:hypothetical protein